METRLAVADDERAALHLEEHGLVPPSPDAQRVVDFLSKRLGGQAWSGWTWIQANVPKQEARAAVRKGPSQAQGVGAKGFEPSAKPKAPAGAAKAFRPTDERSEWSGRKDSNLRPPAPKAGALAKLSYAPTPHLYSADPQQATPHSRPPPPVLNPRPWTAPPSPNRSPRPCSAA